MAILPITQYGDEILNKKTSPVSKVDEHLLKLIKDMFDTMKNAEGIGLAANQVGSNKSIFVVDLSEVKGLEHLKKMVFINPKITARAEELVEMDEGCLSLPGLRGTVKRPKTLTLKYHDIQLKEQVLDVTEMLSRVIQHEYDHLQGIYFTDRLDAEQKKAARDLLIKIRNREMNCDYPITPKPAVRKKKS
jgi:peptide deformylase